MIQALQEREKGLADLVATEADDQDAEPVPVTFDSLQKGDKVRIQSLDAVGEIVGKMPDKNRLVVLTNMMKVEVRPEDLEMVSSKASRPVG
jgi:dsDNA-specific endonuclease/ATPase MutS2